MQQEIPSSYVRNIIEDVFSESSWKDKLEIESSMLSLFESKDIGRFSGEIALLKQRAIAKAASMSSPVLSRRGLEKDARAKLDKLVNTLESKLLYLYDRYRSEDISRKISATRLRTDSKGYLYTAYHEAYKLGTKASGLVRASGLAHHMSDDERTWIEGAIKREHGFFDKLLTDIVRGISPTQARTRIRNYCNAVRSVFDASRILQLPNNVIIHWVLQSHEPCPECRLLHKLSPYTISTLPTTPKAGSSRCLSYCYCNLRIVKATPNEIARVAKRNKSVEYLLKQLESSRKKHHG